MNDRIMLIVGRADSLKKVGEIQESIQLLKKTQPVVESVGKSNLEQLVKIQLADSYLSNNNPDSAEKILAGLLNKFSEMAKKAEVLTLLGRSYMDMGRYEEAIARQEEASALVDSVRQPRIYGRILLNKGTVHEETGNFGSAFNHYLRSIDIAEATADSVLLATALNNIGVAYNNYGQYEEAEHHLQQAIKMNRQINNRVGLLRSVVNLAISQDQLGNFDRSISLYQRAVKLDEEVRKNTPPFQIYYNMGQLYKKKGELDKAEAYYLQSLEYCKKAGIPQGLIYNYGGLANVAELRGNFSKSENYYKRALNIARKISIAPLERDALESLYDLMKSQGAYEEALNYHEKFVVISDSLQNVSRQQEIEKAETKLGLRRQEEINQLLQEKQEQQQARIAVQNWMIGGTVAIIFIISILLLLLSRYNAEKKKANAKLESQQRQLRELNQVKDKILAIISHDLRSPMASMKVMLQMLERKKLSREEVEEVSTSLKMRISQNINMMDNLLAWAREQMSGLEVNTISLKAHDIVEEVIKNFEFQAQGKKISLRNEVPDHIQVQADLNLFSLVVRNLLSNSIKFSHEGDDVVVRTAENTDGSVVFEVADQGIGISEEDREWLFSEGGKPRLGTNNESGSGLGLQLCREFLEKQDGEIAVESREGEGTTFKFSLPKAS
ncbi:tetratricopeptide repeat protein [Fodinibius sediminis]|nr:tetratricopeptide repeat protein [Fodinibius sediminis]